MAEAVIIYTEDWFLYDNGLRHERVKFSINCFNSENVNLRNHVWERKKVPNWHWIFHRWSQHLLLLHLDISQCQWLMEMVH